MTAKRGEVCLGCWKKCHYVDFRDFVPTVYGDRRPPAMRPTFGQEWETQSRKIARDIEDGVGGTGRTAKTVLRVLGRTKRQLWEELTAGCHLRGENGPSSLQEALEWAVSVPARKFRMTARNWTWRQARDHRGGGVTLKEFARWWASVRQAELPFGRLDPEAQTTTDEGWR